MRRNSRDLWMLTRDILQSSLATNEAWERKVEESAVGLICCTKKICPMCTRVHSITTALHGDPEKRDPWDVVASDEENTEMSKSGGEEGKFKAQAWPLLQRKAYHQRAPDEDEPQELMTLKHQYQRGEPIHFCLGWSEYGTEMETQCS